MWHKFGLFLFGEHSVICAHTNRCQSSLYDNNLSVTWVKLDSGLKISVIRSDSLNQGAIYYIITKLPQS